MRGISAAILVVSLLAACGDDGAGTPPPPTIEAGDIVIETDPLRLVLTTADGDTFAVSNFIEVATVSFLDEGRYYDPRDPADSPLIWDTATKAVSYDADTRWLTLDNGVRISVGSGIVDGVQTLVADADHVENAVMVRVAFPRNADEPIYGFGENFASAEAGGSIREMQFRVDLGSESSLNEAHVPVPLSLWPARGVGVFVEDPRPGAFDVGAARADRVLGTFTLAAKGLLRVHMYAVDEPMKLLHKYVELTAPPALPPMWAFAPQQWRNEHDSSAQVLEDANAMRANGIPGSTIWIDNPWQTDYNNFIFEEGRFNNPQQLIDDLTALGYRVLVWSTPYVNKNGLTADDFATARDAGHLVTDDVGQPLVFPWQDGPGALVDFTAPGATEWWRERIARVTSMGIDGFKLDFGEDILPELGDRLAPFNTFAGDAQVMHERYTEHYHEAYFGSLPAGDAFLITRAGTYGDQAVNTCIWPGDLDSDFSRHGEINNDGSTNVGGLPAAVAAGLSLSVSGYPFFGSDIGGFREGRPNTETLIRWSQYAALGTIMQLGGGGTSHNPWDTSLFDAPALSVYQTYSRLHMRLVPYIYTLAIQASTDGTPVTRPTRFVYPDADSDDATFLLGNDIFVAPVVEEGATTRDVILPPGQWVHWWTGATTTGDGAFSDTVSAPLTELPLWRRANSFVPMFALDADTIEPATIGTVTSYADPAYGRELRLLNSPTGAATTTTLHDGTTADASLQGNDYVVDLTAGTTFDIITVQLDNNADSLIDNLVNATFNQTALVVVNDANELAACAAPGCVWFDTNATHARVYLGNGANELRLTP